GGIEEGITMLKEHLIPGGRVPERFRRRILLKLGLLHARRGDFWLADSLLGEGLGEGTRAGPALARDEILLYLNEQAAVKAFLGEDAEALRLCEKGLRVAGRSKARTIREMSLNLRATRANLALRRFDYPRAITDYEIALQTAEAIGSLGNQAIILNNLATAHSQCERYPEAIRAYREAERICRRIDEGPSLASIEGNLAVLHARTGRWEEMEEALREAGRLPPGALGKRQE